MITNISVVMIVKNGARTIRRSLEALGDFEDVVIYDNGSTDSTLSIVKEFKNVNLQQGDFSGFGKTKKKATTYAKNDWILILDADEIVDEQLKSTLRNKELDENCIYSLNFIAFYKDKKIKYCGWNGQKIKRIFNRKMTNYNDGDIHEKIRDDGFKNECLVGNIHHFSFLSISDFIQKTDNYSEIYADENQGKIPSTPFKAVYRAFFHFIKNYIFRLGFMDGYIGLLVCFSGANGVFYKYLKLYEKNNNL